MISGTVQTDSGRLTQTIIQARLASVTSKYQYVEAVDKFAFDMCV